MVVGEVAPEVRMMVVPIISIPPLVVEREIVVIAIPTPVVANPIGGHEPVAFLPFTGPVAMVAAFAALAAPGTIAPTLVVPVTAIKIAVAVEVSVAVKFAVAVKIATAIAGNSAVELAAITQIPLDLVAAAVNFAGPRYRPLVGLTLE
jgi:hypothetical protein